MNLKERRKAKGWTQGDVAKKIDVIQGTYGAYETGRIAMPPEVKKRLEKAGLGGPWPREEAQDAAAGAPALYVTREEYAEVRGALKAHVEYWREGEGKVLLRLEELARRIEAIERRLSL